MNLNTLVNQRQFIAKEEKLSGTELKQSQADVNRMIQITTAPYGKTLSLSNKLMTINNQLLKQLHKNTQQ
jgi:hypothetical protein